MNARDPRFTIEYKNQLLEYVAEQTNIILSKIFDINVEYDLNKFNDENAKILIFDMFFFDFYNIYKNFFEQYSTYKKLPETIEKFSKNLIDNINKKYSQSERIYNNLKKSFPDFDLYVQEEDSLNNIEKYDKVIFKNMLSYVQSLSLQQKELIENQREIIVISDLPTNKMRKDEKVLEGFRPLRIK